MDATRFADLARELAWQLGELRGETWAVAEYEQGNTSAELAGPDHARLGLSWSYREDKLTVRGKYPEGTGGQAFQARVDPQRGLLTIGKDISRRVLGAGYLDALARQVERKATMDAKEAERASWLAKAAALFGIEPPASADRFGRDIEPQLDLGRFVAGRGHVESYHSGSAHLNITLSGIPAQVALDMLAVLAKDIERQCLCCRTYGPAHHPSLALRGCLHRGCQHDEERGEQGSRAAVRDFLESHGVSEADADKALDEARASRYQVSEIYDEGPARPGARLAAIVSWDTEGLGEYTVELKD